MRSASERTDADGPARVPPTPGPLGQRLLAPGETVPLDALADFWVTATVTATVPGHAALVDDLVIMSHIRGALGRVLMEGASAEAIAGRPCGFDPPCGLDVLFREQARMGKHGVPKPWVLALDRRGLDLVVKVTLLGFAIDWTGAVAHALVTALRGRVDFSARARGRFLPAPAVTALTVRERGIVLPPVRETVLIDLITPLDAAGDDPRDRPTSVIGRLARRIDLMARWMDVAIDADWPRLAAHWADLAYDPAGLAPDTLDSRSGRDKRRFARPLLRGTLAVAGDLAPLWPILVLGETCHAGRGATAGLGRYRLG